MRFLDRFFLGLHIMLVVVTLLAIVGALSSCGSHYGCGSIATVIFGYAMCVVPLSVLQWVCCGKGPPKEKGTK